MKLSHFIILCIAVLSALLGGVGYILNRGFHCPIEPAAQIAVESTLKTPLLRYKTDCGRFPTTAEGLRALWKPPAGQTGWKGPYVDRNAEHPDILDPWNRPYRYVSPGVKNPESYDLWSEGPDPSTERDDIVNWSR